MEPRSKFDRLVSDGAAGGKPVLTLVVEAQQLTDKDFCPAPRGDTQRSDDRSNSQSAPNRLKGTSKK